MRRFFQFAAIMLSSLLSLVTHGKAQEPTAREKKGGLAGHLRNHDCSQDDASDTSDPPRRLRRHHHDDSDDIKNSSQAAVWSNAQETGDDTPASKLDPALMSTAEQSDQPLTSIAPSPLSPPLPGDAESRYPWKREIVTTTFWVGETATHNNPVPNRQSCWDPNWARNYGGDDPSDPGERNSNYAPAAFVPGQNPFYIALPYNDMEHGVLKAEASQVIPWFARDYRGPSKSVCQGRWIAIRFGAKVCYAQWEDAGPFSTDHWQYVFGHELPRWNLNRGAGLDVSPAVRDYLGMNSTDVTDWKFVDFDEVPTGPWARFGENNTFVQNARKGANPVVELGPLNKMDEIVPGGVLAPVVEIH